MSLFYKKSKSDLYTERFFECRRGDLTIRGTEYKPEGENLPVAIVSHGFLVNQNTVRQYAQALAELGYAVVNVDSTVVAQRPKLAPHIPQMRENIARALGVELSQVNVKATTEEKLGFTGDGSGMAAQAVALLEKI